MELNRNIIKERRTEMLLSDDVCRLGMRSCSWTVTWCQQTCLWTMGTGITFVSAGRVSEETGRCTSTAVSEQRGTAWPPEPT